jgi:protein-disulfide isomerase
MRNAILAIALAAVLVLAGCAGSPIKEGMDAQGRSWRGAESPKLVIYEYSDFECPFCGQAQPTMEQVLRAYPGDVRLEFRHNPLAMHPRAMPSAIAGVCAEGQGKFWQMHDLMFANQQALEDADLGKYAADTGLDMDKFNACIASPEAAAKVRADMAEAVDAGVTATPSFGIGGTLVRGAQPFSIFKSAIDSELARAG